MTYITEFDVGGNLVRKVSEKEAISIFLRGMEKLKGLMKKER